ncbi:hypothetical protein TSMEX_000879 [Taenia solium]|eukprot:TsM_000030100 transcript=TsM_000030100 gene=TsM_000030100
MDRRGGGKCGRKGGAFHCHGSDEKAQTAGGRKGQGGGSKGCEVRHTVSQAFTHVVAVVCRGLPWFGVLACWLPPVSRRCVVDALLTRLVAWLVALLSLMMSWHCCHRRSRARRWLGRVLSGFYHLLTTAPRLLPYQPPPSITILSPPLTYLHLLLFISCDFCPYTRFPLCVSRCLPLLLQLTPRHQPPTHPTTRIFSLSECEETPHPLTALCPRHCVTSIDITLPA